MYLIAKGTANSPYIFVAEGTSSQLIGINNGLNQNILFSTLIINEKDLLFHLEIKKTDIELLKAKIFDVFIYPYHSFLPQCWRPDGGFSEFSGSYINCIGHIKDNTGVWAPASSYFKKHIGSTVSIIHRENRIRLYTQKIFA